MSTQVSDSPRRLGRPARPSVPSVSVAAAHRFQTPSALQPDWSRERPTRWWDPSRQLLAALRAYARAHQRGGLTGAIGMQLAVLRHRFWSVVTGADIPLNTWRLGGGLLMPHPHGVVIHPDAELGPNCLLLQQVTIGTGSRPGVPRLGAHVDVGAGAKILGGVTIGDHAVIGANAVVISDVPPHAVAVGIPAVVKPRADAPPRSRPSQPPRSEPALRPDAACGTRA